MSTPQIADDALDTIDYALEVSTWLAALMSSIQLDLKHNDGRRAPALAGLGLHLAADAGLVLESESARLTPRPARPAAKVGRNE